MNQTKSINVDVDITLKSTNVRTLDAVLYSQDTNAPQIIIDVKKDSVVVTDAVTATLLLSSANYRGYVTDVLSIKLDGTIADGSVTFNLPNELLAYQGYVRADLYLYWKDGANDAAQPFIFSVKKSTIDAQASVLSYVYISDFEREKLRVTQAANAAIDAIDTNETIAQFTQDKQEVANAKTDALATITNTIAETKEIISKRPDELNDAINQAQDAIAQKVSIVDAQSAIASISQKVDDVDTAKSEAISSINSQTDLSTDVSQAKQSMATSVANVQQTASTESDKITSLLPELENEVSALKTDLQNLSTSETQAISAIRPKLLQDVSDTTAKIDELIVLQNQNAITKQVQIAWANSADGVTDFSKIHYGTNGIPNSNQIFSENEVSDSKERYYYIAGTDISTALLNFFNTNLGKDVILSADVRAKNMTKRASGANRLRCEIVVQYEDGTNDYISAQHDYDGIPDINKRVNVIYTIKNAKVTSVSAVRFFIQINGNDIGIGKPKLELSNSLKLATPWTPNPNDKDASGSTYAAQLASIPKYLGHSNLDSSSYTDYKWMLNPDWILTQHDVDTDKLKQAIIALGGTV